MFKMTDVLEELYAEFPEIEEKSIKKICKAGISGINKMMQSGEELMIDLPGMQEIKFFINSSPQQQDELMKENRRRRRYKKLREQNGKTGTEHVCSGA